MEYLLKCALPNRKVIAADFDSYFIKKAQEFFPEILAIQYDFFKDNYLVFKETLGIECDLAVFFGSAYVMNDDDFVIQFSALREGG
ncbi:MAG: hypothetical protein AB1397_06235 [bacterium]